MSPANLANMISTCRNIFVTLYICFREENHRLSELHASLDQLNREGGELRNNLQRHQRHLAQIKQQFRLKMSQKSKLTLAITELQNAQEEEEPEVEDTATYVRVCVTYTLVLCFIVLF